jgi:hypothetical protein
MHLIGLRGQIAKPVPARDIMFYDAEVASPSILRLTFAFDDGNRWTVKFSEFGFYIHDYK